MQQFMEKEPIRKFLSIFRNEKFLKYYRMAAPVVNAVYLVGGVLLMGYLIISIAAGNDPITINFILWLFGGLMLLPPAIAFIAYPFAILGYSKKDFIKLATRISLIAILLLFICGILGRYIPFEDWVGIGLAYILAASLFWGTVGLCLPKQCFLTHEPTDKTRKYRRIFYYILLLPYLFVFVLEVFDLL